MSLLLNAKDQEICCVYPVPVKLMPFSRSKRHGSGLHSKRCSTGKWPVGLESWSCVCTMAETMAKVRHRLEGESGSIPTCAFLPLRELQPPFLLYLQ